MSEWGETFRAAVLWGPGLIILAGVFVLVRKPPAYISDFIAAQQAQAAAMQQMAATLEHTSRRDDMKLEEILVGVQLVLQRQELMERRLGDGSG
jgi:hypothetical protein